MKNLDCLGTVKHNGVMFNAKGYNYTDSHNGHITPVLARPRILIPGSAKENDGFVLRISSEGPQRWPADLEGKKFYAEWGIEWLEPVKEFLVGQVRTLSGKDRAQLQALSLLRYAHDTFGSNQLASKKALSDAAVLLIEDKALQQVFSAGNPQDVATVFYPAFFTRQVKNAQMVMWCTHQKEFLPAIYCPDGRTASFLAVSYRGLSTCINCYKIFSPDIASVDESTSEKYCTAACGQRYRQKLYRLRQKIQNSKSSKRKAGKR